MKLPTRILVVGDFTKAEISQYNLRSNTSFQCAFADKHLGEFPVRGSPDLVVIHQSHSSYLAENIGTYAVPTVRIVPGLLNSEKKIRFSVEGFCSVLEVDDHYWQNNQLYVVRLAMSKSLPRLAQETTCSDGSLLGKSPKMRDLMAQIRKLGPTAHMILVEGESGTGKELAAKEIHKHSAVSKNSYTAVNCGALTGSVLESELFGCEKGAFTGAENKAGYFEHASGGTLFLDEVGEIPLEHQPKLLRVLENREFQRVGSRKLLRMDARIITATNRNLREEMAKGTFRQDLYYRLNVVSLTLPPLRERLEDIPLLAHHFLSAEGYQGSLSSAVIQKLMSYSWPGNVRELKNTLFKAFLASDSGVLFPEMVEFH